MFNGTVDDEDIKILSKWPFYIVMMLKNVK